MYHKTTQNAWYLFIMLWLVTTPLLRAETMIPLENSVRPVEPMQDATHPERAFISRQTLRSDEVSATMPFEMSLKMRNFAGLQARVAKGEQISLAEMAAKYEPTEESYQQVANWLTVHGFTITRRDSHHVMIFAEGPVSQIQQTMRVSFARVTANQAEYTSAITAPQLPGSLSALLVGVNGLQPHIRPVSHLMMSPNAVSKMSIGGPSYYKPSDIAKAYQATPLYNSGVNGAGQTIAIIIDTFPKTSDLTAFWSGSGISQSLNNIQFIQAVNGTMGGPTGEETLDVEWSSAMAPAAKVRVYGCISLDFSNLDQGYAQLYEDVTTHPEYNIHQMSMSYGLGEEYTSWSQMETDDQIYAELGAAGVTVFASSGDCGSTPQADTNEGGGTQLMPCYPACDPSVTGVGGTSLNAPSGVEQDEEVWNDNNGYASGGGISQYFATPAWQTVGTSTGRQVPDIAGSADPNHGGIVVLNGGNMIFGGTSWSSPTNAGFMALINQARANAGGGPVGPLNPQIYALIGTSCFRDITVGNNACPGTASNLYAAGVGYDLCTGVGSMQVQNLAAQLSKFPSVTPTSLTMPTVPINTPSTGSFTISNPTAIPLVVTSMNYPLGLPIDWTSGTIPPGGSQVVHITMTLVTPGTLSDAIQIFTNASSSPIVLPFSMTATSGSASQIAVNPPSLTLPSVSINTATTSSFTISNSGSASLTVSGIAVPVGMQLDWTSGTIAANSSQVVNVTYTPTTVGVNSGAIQISSNASSTALNLPFSVTATAAPSQIAVNPTSLTLPSVVVNTASSGSFTLSNSGSASLTVSSISCPAGMQLDWTSGTIAASSTQVVNVTYTPTNLGAHSGVIQIANSASGTPLSLPFSVTATPPPLRPSVLTNFATLVSGNSATLNASVNPNGSPANAYFQYGPTTAYGNTTAAASAGSGSNALFAQSITGLTGNTSYHFRAVATNSAFTVYGSDMTFTTMPQPTFGSLALTGNDGSGAKVSGVVTSNGVATTVYIQYGTTPAYGSETSGFNVSAKSAATTVSEVLSGLQPGTTYYYRIVTISASGTYYGPSATFVSAPFTVSTIYTSGSSVPDIANAEFSTFSNPAINDQDNLAFKATMLTGHGGITTANATGIWAADDTGTTHLVAQEGTVAPGTAKTLSSGTVTANFATFSDPVYNNNGQVAFSATLTAGSAAATGTTTGIWSNSSGTLSLVARLGSPAPGFAANVNFSNFEGVALPDQGGVILLATVGSGKTAGTGIWEGTSAADLQLLAQTGESLNGKTVTGLAILPNSAVQTRSFTQQGANLALVVTFSDKSTAVVTLVGDTWDVAAQTSDTAAGIANGQFASFGNPVINAQNHTAFAAKLSSGAAGVWADDNSGTRNLLAAEGTSAPGTSAEFTSFSDPVDNSNDTVAFVAKLSNNTTGIWAGTQPELVAQTGSQAPGCATGIDFSAFSQMALPDQGGVVFLGTVKGTGVSSQNSTGIWAVDSSNNLNLVMRAGDIFGGKTIASFSFLPEETVVGSQTRSFIQDSGDLAYLVINSDKSTSLLKVVFP